jgi:hypothetical protein
VAVGLGGLRGVKILIKKTGGFTITKLTLSEKITTTCDYLKKYDVTCE